MRVVSGRDFRANQSKYITEAHNGEDIIITSRAGDVRLVPIKPDDIIVSRDEIPAELAALIDKARAEYREGKAVKLNTHEEIDRYFDSL